LGASGQFVADGARVSLVELGPPPTQLKRDDGQTAKLTLKARFIERLRGDSNDESRDLAELDGSVLLEDGNIVFTADTGDDGDAVGLVPTEEVADDDDVSEDDPREVRLLRFDFDSGQFPELTLDGEPLELAVRIDAARFDYCEVSAVLEVAGASEADADVNDTLDILITARNPTPRRTVVVRFTDETGEPMPGAAVQILSGAKPSDSTADPDALTADGDGELSLRNVAGAETCELAWGPSADDLRFTRTIFLDLGDDSDIADERRLQNLGYPEDRSLDDNVLSFQADFARAATGRVSDVNQDLVSFHDDGTKPTPGDASEPSTDAVAVNGPTAPEFDDLSGANTDASAVA
jgi:hypothetical protein